MTKLIHIHIGAHKTGTTLIQRSILNPANLVSRLNKKLCILSIHNPEYGYSEFRKNYTNYRNKALLLIHQGADVPGELRNEWSQVISNFISSIDAEQIVWSDENLLGSTPGHPAGQIIELTGTLYPGSEVISSVFRDALKENDVSVRLHTRQLDTLVRSSYADWIIKLRAPTTFEEFSSAFSISKPDWNEVIEPWKRRFGIRFSSRVPSIGVKAESPAPA